MLDVAFAVAVVVVSAVHAATLGSGFAFEAGCDGAVVPARAVSPGWAVIRFAVVAAVLLLLLLVVRCVVSLLRGHAGGVRMVTASTPVGHAAVVVVHFRLWQALVNNHYAAASTFLVTLCKKTVFN